MIFKFFKIISFLFFHRIIIIFHRNDLITVIHIKSFHLQLFVIIYDLNKK